MTTHPRAPRTAALTQLSPNSNQPRVMWSATPRAQRVRRSCPGSPRPGWCPRDRSCTSFPGSSRSGGCPRDSRARTSRLRCPRPGSCPRDSRSTPGWSPSWWCRRDSRTSALRSCPGDSTSTPGGSRRGWCLRGSRRRASASRVTVLLLALDGDAWTNDDAGAAEALAGERGGVDPDLVDDAVVPVGRGRVRRVVARRSPASRWCSRRRRRSSCSSRSRSDFDPATTSTRGRISRRPPASSPRRR